MSEFNALDLEEVRAWREGFVPPIDTLDAIVNRYVGSNRFLVSMELIWPKFIEDRGCAILPWQFERRNFEDWWKSLDGNRARIESVLNHFHLWDLFWDDDVAEAPLLQIGHVLSRTWAMALAEQFPDRRVNIEFIEDPDDYGPTIYWEALD